MSGVLDERAGATAGAYDSGALNEGKLGAGVCGIGAGGIGCASEVAARGVALSACGRGGESTVMMVGAITSDLAATSALVRRASMFSFVVCLAELALPVSSTRRFVGCDGAELCVPLLKFSPGDEPARAGKPSAERNSAASSPAVA